MSFSYRPNDDGTVTLLIEGGDPQGHTFDPSDFPDLERERDDYDYPNDEPVGTRS